MSINTSESIMKIIADIAAIEVKSIDENMDVVKDLNFDSFDLIDMIFKIERELNLENICDIYLMMSFQLKLNI